MRRNVVQRRQVYCRIHEAKIRRNQGWTARSIVLAIRERAKGTTLKLILPLMQLPHPSEAIWIADAAELGAQWQEMGMR